MQNNYSYVQAIASVEGLTEAQAEDLFNRIAEVITTFEEEHEHDCNTSLYIFNNKEEAVY